MLVMTIGPMVALGLLAFSVAVTLAADWLASGLRRPTVPRAISFTLVLSFILNLLWIVLVFVAGIIATRYIERVANPVLGYLVFGLLAFLLSLARARLHMRIEQQLKEEPLAGKLSLPADVVHNLTYVLLAIALYLALSWLLHRSAELILFIPLCLGALLPDLDRQDSALGRLLPFVSRRLEARFGHEHEWHTLVAAAFVGLITAPLLPVIRVQAWCLIVLGFLSHLILDMLGPQGIMLLWPITRTQYSVLGGPLRTHGGPADGRFAAALAAICFILLLVVDIGPQPPPPAPAPSFEQTVARYFSMRGNNLVFARVDGTWQISGRRMNGRFEILNAAGESFLLLDRFSGKIFTAGRSADDHFYVNGISLQTGPAADIKSVEIHLQDQRLAKALPVLYEMQREPGLQYIYVSGDVVAPIPSNGHDPSLQADYAQTSLRRIQAHADGHYTFHYMTARDLIGLADVQVETADLVIVATYISPDTGPTVTPLPSPPSTPQAAAREEPWFCVSMPLERVSITRHNLAY